VLAPPREQRIVDVARGVLRSEAGQFGARLPKLRIDRAPVRVEDLARGVVGHDGVVDQRVQGILHAAAGDLA
jgi:hypothetical protein